MSSILIGRISVSDQELHVFSDMSYRYEPNYTKYGCRNSLLRIFDGRVQFKHIEKDDLRNDINFWEQWRPGKISAEEQTIINIVLNFTIEQTLLGAGNADD